VPTSMNGTSAGTSPVLVERLAAAYAGTTVGTARTEAEIAGYLAGLDLAPPGLADVRACTTYGRRRWHRSGQRSSSAGRSAK